jgi:hypothetical protein
VDESPEAEVMRRWQKREFNEVERLHARAWRASLSGVDFGAMIEWAKRIVPADRKIASLSDAKAFAQWFVTQPDAHVVTFALQFLNIPDEYRATVEARHAAAGHPPLDRFAPYASFVLKVDIVFALAMSIDRISAERPSNMVDVSYLCA